MPALGTVLVQRHYFICQLPFATSHLYSAGGGRLIGIRQYDERADRKRQPKVLG